MQNIQHGGGRRLQRHRLCAAGSTGGGPGGSGNGDGSKESAALGPDRWKLYAALVAFAVTATLFLTYGSDTVQDLLYGDGLDTGTLGGGPSAGDVTGGVLWSVALYFCSPLQLLLLFLGRIETERPSDWLLRLLGSATGQRVDDTTYDAPLVLRAAAIAVFAASGAGVAWLFQTSLGDATWSVSTGLGACMAAGLFEVGRPKRLSREEADQLDAEWRDFADFARERLQRSGRCHESEVVTAFRQSVARYRSADAMPDERVRDFIRNWHPDAGRTPSGFYKALSLRARTDPFSGEASGAAAAAAAAPGAASETA